MIVLIWGHSSPGPGFSLLHRNLREYFINLSDSVSCYTSGMSYLLLYRKLKKRWKYYSWLIIFTCSSVPCFISRGKKCLKRRGKCFLLSFRVVLFNIVSVKYPPYISAILLILLNKHLVSRGRSFPYFMKETYVFYKKFGEIFCILIEEINLVACLMFLYAVICF